jgi:hypothetical protein
MGENVVCPTALTHDPTHESHVLNYLNTASRKLAVSLKHYLHNAGLVHPKLRALASLKFSSGNGDTRNSPI